MIFVDDIYRPNTMKVALSDGPSCSEFETRPSARGVAIEYRDSHGKNKKKNLYIIVKILI